MSDIIQQFKEYFGSTPVVHSLAPGRLEILGNHTDYNEGFVLSCAVTQYTEMVLAPRSGNICRLVDFRDGSSVEFDMTDIAKAKPKDWSNYIKGVIVELEKRGEKVGAFDAAILSTVPLSAGMSSSAALEMAASMAFAKAFNIDLSKAEWARVGQGTENNYMHLKSGLLDQFSSLYGQEDAFILSDFRSVEVLQTVTMPKGYSLIVANSMVKHNLVDSAYNDRRRDCENAAEKLAKVLPNVKTLRDVSLVQLNQFKAELSEVEYKRAYHVVGEDERVMEAINALNSGDINHFGELLTQSHLSSKDYFENSSPELDILVDFAMANPLCLGARLSGGGFGGITIHLVAEKDVEQYIAELRVDFQKKVQQDPQIIICKPGAGATAELIK